MQIFDSPDAVRKALGPTVATIGKYDGMHLGHQSILREVRARAAACGLPTLVILSEPHPEEYFSPQTAPPRLNHFRDKVDFLANTGIDAVLRLQFDESVSSCPAERFVSEFLVAQLGVQVLIVGDDFRFGQGRAGDYAMLKALSVGHGFAVSSVPPCSSGTERVSSTLVRNYLAEGKCADVTRLLGRPYSIGGTIVRGRQLGRQLGVPTANVTLSGTSLPTSGVFAVHVECAGQWYEGVANLGVKPTVDAEPRPSLEVHLFDFSDNIYGEYMRVHFLEKLRAERKFDSLQALQEQIVRDQETARRVLADFSLPAHDVVAPQEHRP